MEGLWPPESFTTARLVLRRPRPDDAEAIFSAYAADPEVTRFLTWLPHETAEDTRTFLRSCDEMWAGGESFPFVIGAPPDAAEPFGMIHFRLTLHAVEFGYVLARTHWGKGYMAEALEILADWCLAQPGVFRVSAFCDVENAASARVMQKAGMWHEGRLASYSLHPGISPEPRDVFMYAKVKR